MRARARAVRTAARLKQPEDQKADEALLVEQRERERAKRQAREAGQPALILCEDDGGEVRDQIGGRARARADGSRRAGGECTAVVDTGTSMLLLPGEDFDEVMVEVSKGKSCSVHGGSAGGSGDYHDGERYEHYRDADEEEPAPTEAIHDHDGK